MVFTVFRLLTDFVCLYNFEFWLSLCKIVRSSGILLLPVEVKLYWSRTDKLYHIILYRVYLAWSGLELTTLVVIGTDCRGSYKANYHTFTTTMAAIVYLNPVVAKIIQIYGYLIILCISYNKWLIQHCLNIVESGVKYHKSQYQTIYTITGNIIDHTCLSYK
jgi:hypothetical protein